MTLRQNLILILCLAALLGANSHADETPRQVDAVVIFSQFADEAATPVPGYAGDLIDSTVPDSFSHFYPTMSSGQFSCPGARHSSALSFRPVRGDLTVVDGEFGDYPTFVREILVQADADIDWTQFDNDGPDGVAVSGDDDSIVDYLFVGTLSAPKGFTLGGATGRASLGLESDFLTADQRRRREAHPHFRQADPRNHLQAGQLRPDRGHDGA